MNLLPFVLITGLFQMPSPNWEKGVAEVDQLLKERHGIALVVSLEAPESNSINYQALQRGGEDSAWKLELMPLDPQTGQPQEGDELSFLGGGVPHMVKPMSHKFKIHAGVQKLLLRFRTAKFKGLAKVVELPKPGGSPTLVSLYLPEP